MAKNVNNQIFVNGQLYTGAFVGVMIGSNVLTVGLTSINYKEATAMENKFGLGQYAIGRGVGRITCEGDITLYKEEIVAIQRAAGNLGDAQRSLSTLAPFDIIVEYNNSDYSRATVDILKDCQFMNNEIAGDMEALEFTTTITLVMSSIIWGV